MPISSAIFASRSRLSRPKRRRNASPTRVTKSKSGLVAAGVAVDAIGIVALVCSVRDFVQLLLRQSGLVAAGLAVYAIGVIRLVRRLGETAGDEDEIGVQDGEEKAPKMFGDYHKRVRRWILALKIP